jgi:hypothetical protein
MSAGAPEREVVVIGMTPDGPVHTYDDGTSELIPVPGGSLGNPDAADADASGVTIPTDRTSGR